MNLNAAQKATCKRMTDRFVKKDPSAMAFFDRLKGPVREAFLTERTKLLGTVQQNEFGLPDEPSLAPSQVQSIVRKTRAELEGDSSAVQFIDKVREQAKAGQAYAQAMMRIHDALVEKLKNASIAQARPVGVRVTKRANDGSISVQRALSAPVPQSPETRPAPPDENEDIDLASLVVTGEANPEYDKLVATCGEQISVLLTTLTPETIPGFPAEAAKLLNGLQLKDHEAILLGARVFSHLFMPKVAEV